jgi:hypothetical protein
LTNNLKLFRRDVDHLLLQSMRRLDYNRLSWGIR